MNNAYNQVKKFHEACGVEMPDKPTLLSGAGDERNIARSEELDDLSHMLKKRSDIGGEVRKRASYILEELAEFMKAETVEDQADALIDLIYFALGTFTLMGIKPERIFDIVQAANIAKVGPDGKVIKDEQGKIRKPEGWKPPEEAIEAEIARQTNPCPTCNGESKPIYGLECPVCL